VWESFRTDKLAQTLQYRPETGRKIVIDIGAFVGYFGFQAVVSGATVFLIEPILESAKLIAKTIKLNKWENKAFVFQNAASDDVFSLFFFPGRENPASHGIRNPELETFDQNALTQGVILDDLVEFNLIDPTDVFLIKIDTNNEFDTKSLHGMSKIIARGKPPYISIENLGFNLYGCDWKKFFDLLLNKLHYRMVWGDWEMSFDEVVQEFNDQTDRTLHNVFLIASGHPIV